jgi:hypothetical protein
MFISDNIRPTVNNQYRKYFQCLANNCYNLELIHIDKKTQYVSKEPPPVSSPLSQQY